MKQHTFHGAECSICNKSIKTNNKSKRSICFMCNNRAPPDKYRCEGINSKGNRCGQWAKVDKEHCAHHESKEE